MNFTGDNVASTAGYLDGLERIEQLLESRGLSLPPGSRLLQYRRALRELRTRSSDAVVGPGLQAAYEVRQLNLIFDQLGSLLPEREVAFLLSGHFRHDTEGSQSPARDRQFELFMAALCRQAGMGVELEEPDFIARWVAGTLAVAAKRVKGTGKIGRRLLKADQQIERSGVNGAIVLELTPRFNPRQLFYRRERDASEEVGGWLDRFVGQNEHEVQRSAGPKLCGLLIHVAVPMISEGKIGTYTYIRGIGTVGSDDPRQLVMRDFTKRLARSVARV